MFPSLATMNEMLLNSATAMAGKQQWLTAKSKQKEGEKARNWKDEKTQLIALYDCCGM